jgi:hypothetical protein
MTRLVFGQPIPREYLPHFRRRRARKSYAKGTRANPCIKTFGAGPEGEMCRGCIHLMRHQGASRTFLKCALRQNTSGPATDHFASWPACAKFEKEVL